LLQQVELVVLHAVQANSLVSLAACSCVSESARVTSSCDGVVCILLQRQRLVALHDAKHPAGATATSPVVLAVAELFCDMHERRHAASTCHMRALARMLCVLLHQAVKITTISCVMASGCAV
jgi:hypothetical protein